jgi:hypothetical protein
MILAGGWETIAVSTDPGCNIDVSNGEVHIELPAKSGMILR